MMMMMMSSLPDARTALEHRGAAANRWLHDSLLAAEIALAPCPVAPELVEQLGCCFLGLFLSSKIFCEKQ
jgi:hypothetical protein